MQKDFGCMKNMVPEIRADIVLQIKSECSIWKMLQDLMTVPAFLPLFLLLYWGQCTFSWEVLILLLEKESWNVLPLTGIIPDYVCV